MIAFSSVSPWLRLGRASRDRDPAFILGVDIVFSHTMRKSFKLLFLASWVRA